MTQIPQSHYRENKEFEYKNHTRRNLNSYSCIGKPPVLGFSHNTVYSNGQAPTGSDVSISGYGTATSHQSPLSWTNISVSKQIQSSQQKH